jgi:hypothetical protein
MWLETASFESTRRQLVGQSKGPILSTYFPAPSAKAAVIFVIATL